MKNLILIRGVSGSGKTTLANLIGGKNYEADNFFENALGEYNFDPNKLTEAHNWCLNSVRVNMEWGHPLITVSNTFTTGWEMEPYFKLAEKYGYKVSTIIVENRHGNDSVHSVPSKTRENQSKKLKQNIKLI